MRLRFILILIISSIFSSCRNNNSEEMDTVELSQQYFLEDMTEVILDIYQIDSLMYPILDSIIEKVLACPQNLNQQIGFVFSIDDKLSKKFSIFNTINTNAQYYLDYKGIFYYKGYQFGIYNDSNFNYLKKLNQKAKVFSISNEKFPTWYQDYKFDSFWVYSLKNGQFECTELKFCGAFIRKES